MKKGFILSACFAFCLLAIYPSSVTAQAKADKKSAAAASKGEAKLKELPDPASVNWKKDRDLGYQLFQRGSLYNGLHYYEEAVNKNPKETELFQPIAEGNFQLRDYKTANKYYKMLVDLDTVKHNDYRDRFQYALTDKFMGNYEKAKLNFEQLVNDLKNAKDQDELLKRAQLELAGCDLGIQLRDDKTYKEIKITHLDNNINQPFTDYAPVLKDPSTLYFSSWVSDKVELRGMREQYADFSRLYVSKKDGDKWGKSQLLPGEVNTIPVNVGNPTFAADGKTMYYTQCMEDDQQAMRCNIYKSLLGDSGWVAGIKLDADINTNGATNTEPALGKNEAGEIVLYFVSDRSGKSNDLYYAKLNSDGTFEKAKPLSTVINTAGNEMSPFYDFQTNTLYFSSDGHVSIGGMDVFRTKAANGSWSEPENLGLPINSSVDDMYYNWNEKEGLGFVVSNRPGGFGLKSETCCDDIYQLYQHKIYLAVKGTVTYIDSTTRPANGQPVSLMDSTGKVLKTFNTVNGAYFFDILPDKNYKLSAMKDEYFTASQQFNTIGKDNSDTLAINLTLKMMEKNKAYSLNNIYYEFDKADLTPASKLVLDTLYNILIENPKIVIELSSHTDSKGADKYNMDLSQKRAESCVNYLVNEKGIPKERIVAKGYGKTVPVAPNTNPDGSDNPEGRAKNRRTEFKIIDELKK